VTQSCKNTIRVHYRSTPCCSGMFKDGEKKRANCRNHNLQNGNNRSQCQSRDFSYTEVFDVGVSEERIYMTVAQPIVRGCLNSKNKQDGTIVAWGIKEAGKTYTILGSKNYETRPRLEKHSKENVDSFKKNILYSKAACSNLNLSYNKNHENYVSNRKKSDVTTDDFHCCGILGRTVYDLFCHTENVKIWLSVFQCTADERILDKLVNGCENDSELKTKYVNGVFIDGCTEKRVNSVKEAFLVIEEAHRYHNIHSNASGHFFYRFLIEKNFGHCKYETDNETIILDSHGTSPLEKCDEFRAGCGCALNRNLIGSSEGKMAASYKCTLLIVDTLACDHRKKYQSSSKIKASPSIGMTLTPLAAVISALTRKKDDRFVPYRDSKFTLILKNSLGGSARTAFIMLLDPLSDYDTIIQTLIYGIHIQKIKNKIVL